MNRMLLPLALAILGLLLLLGCGGGLRHLGQLAGSRQVTSTDPPTLTITAAPANNATLSEGEFILEGVVAAPGGLRAEHPLMLVVTDLDSGLSVEYPLLANFDIMEADGELSSSYFDPGTGEFRLDAETEFALEGSGPRQLELILTDAFDREDRWTATITIDPPRSWFDRPAGIASRAAFEAQMLDALEAYRSLLGSLTFEAPYETPDLDRDILDAVWLCYKTCVDAPQGMAGAEAGLALETTIEGLLVEQGSTSDPGELAWREALTGAAAELREDRVVKAETALNLLFHKARPTYDQTTHIGRIEQAYFDHTSVHSQIQTGPEGPLSWPDDMVARFRVVYFQDTGAPPRVMRALSSWDPNGVTPNSGDPDEPVMELIVNFWDQDTDGAVDHIDWEGFEYLPETQQHGPLPGLPQDYGHTITPLSHFLGSRYASWGAL